MIGFRCQLKRERLEDLAGQPPCRLYLSKVPLGCTFQKSRPSPRGLHSFTLELNLSNSRTHSGLSWVTRWTEELKLS